MWSGSGFPVLFLVNFDASPQMWIQVQQVFMAINAPGTGANGPEYPLFESRRGQVGFIKSGFA
jgi:hypothetical protein